MVLDHLDVRKTYFNDTVYKYKANLEGPKLQGKKIEGPKTL